MKTVSRTSHLRPGEPDPNLDRVRRRDGKSAPPLTGRPWDLNRVRDSEQERRYHDLCWVSVSTDLPGLFTSHGMYVQHVA